MATLCLPDSDAIFGPQVDSTCRSFDFTLYFEDIFLLCLPATVFILLLPATVISLLSRPVVIKRNSKLLAAKIVSPIWANIV